MSRPLSLILAFIAFFLFILLSVTPSLWADEDLSDISYSDFEAELKSVEANELGSQIEKRDLKQLEEKEMMAEMITDEVQNEQSAIKKTPQSETAEQKIIPQSEPEKILPSTTTMKKRRIRSR